MRYAEILFLDVEDVVAVHARAIARHGGSDGIRDPGLLSSAVAAPTTGYYGSLAELAATLCYGLAKNHAFIDGNKRVAAGAMLTFLEANGYPLTLEPDRWEAIIVGVAAGKITRDELTAHLATEMGGDVTIA